MSLKKPDLVEWMISLFTHDYILQFSLVTVSYLSGNLFAEAIFFVQGVLTLSKIANEENPALINPFFRKLLDLLLLKQL